MRLNEQHQLISQGLRWQATPYVPFSAVATILALFLPSSWLECQEDATAFVRTSQAKSSPNRKKISSNTAPTAPTLSTRFISAAKNSQSAILSAVFSNRLTISPPQTMLYFAPNDVSFRLKCRFVSPQTLRRYCSHFGKKLILLVVFFASNEKKTKSSHRLYPFLCIFAHK
ncbi:Uncharacterised protein [Prevotella denticola]|uniref:Uncharacterized protein n=1 Tax=Prevotella denticola TaxID=28129 RepID=A0A379EF05_9BACT|nr:Uncharacterised protein [Prevotella denticola]